MALISTHELSLAFGSRVPLLDKVGFEIDTGERIALLGRNGAGKSSLMKVLAAEITADSGRITRKPSTRIARLSQEVPQDLVGEVTDVVASGLPEAGNLLAAYHRLSHSDLRDPADLAKLEALQHQLEAAGGWHLEQRVETMMSRLQLPDRGRFETLSGGLKRRVLLARALVSEPDLLLLDEPTNHLDIPAIEWLQELLRTWSGALLFVTHDRAFLRSLATRILEIDRGVLSDWPGDYARFLERKEHQLTVEADQNARFDKKLAQEEAWIRQGIKARRTRNEGRVRALERLRGERRARRQTSGQARLRIDDAGRSGKRVIVAKHVSFAYDGGSTLIDDFSTALIRGDKVGILGPNGSGKSTLLNLMLGRLDPGNGNVRHGTQLEVAYFDQHREQLDETRSVADNVADGNDRVVVGGQPRHIISYLQDFLFPPDQTRSPVSSLSGGERNRLVLARLFARSFNLLVMDEPTNDLDVETLELLETLLVEFEGTLLLVSHDRAFLDNVVTSSLVMEGAGRVGEYAGGYSDWLLQRPQSAEKQALAESPSGAETPPGAERPSGSEKRAAAGAAKSTLKPTRTDRPRKLSYREKQDLEALPARIEALETEQASLHARFADPETYRREGDTVASHQRRLAELDQELATAYERWQALEALG